MTADAHRHASLEPAAEADLGAPSGVPFPTPSGEPAEPNQSRPPVGAVRASARVGVPAPTAPAGSLAFERPSAFEQPLAGLAAPTTGMTGPSGSAAYTPPPANAGFPAPPATTAQPHPAQAQGGPAVAPPAHPAAAASGGRASGTAHVPEASLLPAHQLPTLPKPVPRVYGRPSTTAPGHPGDPGQSGHAGPALHPGQVNPAVQPGPASHPGHPGQPAPFSPAGPPAAVPPMPYATTTAASVVASASVPAPAAISGAAALPAPTLPPPAPALPPQPGRPGPGDLAWPPQQPTQRTPEPGTGPMPEPYSTGQPIGPHQSGAAPRPDRMPERALDDHADQGSMRGMLITIGVIVLVAVAAMTALLWPRAEATSPFTVGVCAKNADNTPVVVSCTDAGAFKVVAQVASVDQCEDQTQPYILLGGGSDRVLCLAPVGGSAPTPTPSAG